jgi:DNA polymerase
MIAAAPTAPRARPQRLVTAEPRDEAQARSADDTDLAALRVDAEGCRACPLWANATQTVFGEGPETAAIVFVGEQPGDKEDLAGRPFVGPAGQLFDRALAEAGIERSITYVTNAVKHFKFEPRGKFRLHKKPNAGEISACRWWVTREIELIAPQLVVALGATAVQSLTGRAIPITRHRGGFVEGGDGRQIFVTVHPSYLLRLPDEESRTREFGRFVEDLRAVAAAVAA